MIRKYTKDDIEAVLDIWLKASIKAHDFIDPEFWESQLENMRSIYIPSSKTYVFIKDAKVTGFYSLNRNVLAAIFVEPEMQGNGIGKQLIIHAKSQIKNLTLSVYKENSPALKFYLTQDFKIIKEQTDEHTGHLEYIMAAK